MTLMCPIFNIYIKIYYYNPHILLTQYANFQESMLMSSFRGEWFR